MATPTPDLEVTEEAIETAVAATLEALETPTPTTDPVVARLTAVAIEKLTAEARTPTATATPTLTPTPTPTQAVPSMGELREFGGIPFVYVPAGEFIMGSSDDDELADADEKPQRTVYLDTYWIMQTEVTNALYGACVAADECREPDNEQWNSGDYSEHPVTDVSWDDAVSYAVWLSAETGQALVLPTEAQWEKAARGTDGYIYPWGDDGPDGGLLNTSYHVGATTPVGAYPNGASPYGALDMAGNVWEWTADRYGESYYAGSSDNNPIGPASGDFRVARGGAWHRIPGVNSTGVRLRFFPEDVRAAVRAWSLPDGHLDALGFRLASPGF